MAYEWIKNRLEGQRGAQGELARAIGIQEDKLAKVFAGKRRFTPQEIAGVAKFFEIPIEYVLNGDSEQVGIGSSYRGNELSNAEVAMVYVFKEVINILLGRTKATKKTLIDDLGFALENYRKQDLPGAILVMDDLLAHVRDDKRAQEQQALQKMLMLSPPRSA